MPVKVVDVSAVAAMIFGEPENDRVADRLTGATLKSPTLFDYELSSVCLKKFRKSDIPNAALIAYQLRRGLTIELVQVDHDDVLKLAQNTGLTAYDASYLWLSEHLGVELVTLDKQLAKAAARR